MMVQGKLWDPSRAIRYVMYGGEKTEVPQGRLHFFFDHAVLLVHASSAMLPSIDKHEYAMIVGRRL